MLFRFVYRLLPSLFCMLPIACADSSSTDNVEIRSQVKSPNGQLVATSFYCEGGGAAGFCFENVDLQPAGQAVDHRNGLLGKHKTWNSFSEISLRWIDDQNLEVSYRQSDSPDYREHNLVRAKNKHGVQMHYRILTDGKEGKPAS